MPALDNPRHEAFAQAMASTVDPATVVFRRLAGGKKRTGDGEQASRLLKKVETRIAEIQADSKTQNTLTMQERREFIARVVRVKLHDLDLSEDGDLIQEITRTEGSEGKAGVEKVKLPGKLDSIMADAKLAGELIDRVEATVDMSRVIPKDKRRELLAAAIARRTR